MKGKRKMKAEELYQVKKSDHPVDWTVTVPGSKSITNRALLLSALSDGEVTLDGVLFSEDSRVFLGALQSLGFELQIDERKKQVVLKGCCGEIPKKKAEIYVGSAGTAARFLTAMLGCSSGVYTILASEQMKQRPMKPLFEVLEHLGAEITYLEQKYFLPVKITGCRRQNVGMAEAAKKQGTAQTCAEKPFYAELDISKSTQFLSALLLVSPMFEHGIRIHITGEKTDGSYIRITRQMMETFGVTAAFNGRDYQVLAGAVYRKKQYAIEPDMSAACYFYAAAAITGGCALVRNVHSDNTQGDLKFLEVLRQLGCRIKEKPEGIVVYGPKEGNLRGICINMNDFSDQAMTLAAIAPFCKEKVRIEGIAHIRLQESDRLHGIAAELTRLGISCREEEAAVTIYPGAPKAGVVETYEDHRMAMAFSLIGLRADGIVIKNPSCCKKTFENYFELLEELCTSY